MGEQDRFRGKQYATFFLDNHLLGVEVQSVQEVLLAQRMTPVPLAPDMIQGLINLRGQIVTAVDLRARLGFAPRPGDADPMNVVIQTRQGLVSLLVDWIGDVIEVSPALFEPTPETMDPRLKEVAQGVYKLKNQLLLALDTDAVIQPLKNAMT